MIIWRNNEVFLPAAFEFFSNIWNDKIICFQINPDYTIPTLVDDDFVSWDTHAILNHLVEKYGSDDSLYPKDPDRKDQVDQKLFFESDTLCPRVNSIIVRISCFIAHLNVQFQSVT